MGAALHPAHPLERRLDEALADGKPGEAGEILRRMRADRRIGRVVGHRLAGDDVERLVDGEPHPHPVQRLARRHVAALLALEALGFGIGEQRLDVEQPILALIAVDDDTALVQDLAGRSGGTERHLSTPLNGQR